MNAKKALLFSLGGTVAMVLPAQAAMSTDAIPYAYAGTYVTNVYSFTAASTGPVDAYFCGSTAAWTENLGMMVNGTSVMSGVFNNQTTTVGTKQVMGNVNAGDVLTFYITLVDTQGAGYTGTNVYSNPTMNTGAYASGYPDHVYATPYTDSGSIDVATNASFIGSDLLTAVPVTGTFVGFEDNTPTDVAFGATDWNYNDETFVFTNLAAVPEPASMGLLLLGGVGLLVRRVRKTPA